jgi:pilus assembly protein CpaE
MAENQMINVLLVTGRDPVSDWLIATLRSETNVVLTGAVPTLDRAMSMIGQRKIDVILLDSAVPDAKQIDRLQALAAMPLSPAVILVVTPSEMPFVQQALFAGARGFLLKPFTHQQLTESLWQTYTVLTQQRQLVPSSAAAHARDQSAEIIVLFSPKGGVGRTSIAANLAIALYQETRKPVTLVDGDLRFGDVDIAINLMARKSVADLLAYVNELEKPLIDSVLTEHASGIRVLLAPPYFDPALEADEGRLAHVIKSLAAVQAGYVIVDAPADLGESTLNLLDIAQRVLLVTTASVASLRATKRFMELARKLDYPDNKIMLLISNYRKDDISLDDVERHLSWGASVAVPSDPSVMALALNQGQPIVARDRNHPISKAILKLARQLDANPAAASSALDSEEAANSSTPSRSRGLSLMRLRPGTATGS